MRVIAGSARRLQLRTVPGMETRPTTDRIKETLFNMIALKLPNAYFLDLFSGSGAIGIEALSRGANKAIFVDNNRKAVEVIHDNLLHTHLSERAIVMANEVNTAIRILEDQQITMNVIFMDPPYNHEYEREVMERLQNSCLVDENTLIIIESSSATQCDYLDSMGYYIDKIKEYKTNKHYFVYRKVED